MDSANHIRRTTGAGPRPMAGPATAGPAQHMGFPRHQAASGAVATASSGALLALFMATIVTPMAFDVGGLRLDLFRLYVMLALLPCLILLATNRKGPFVISDLFMVAFGLLVVATIFAHEGTAKLAYASISGIEYVGGYLVGRVLIRNAGDYRTFIRYFVIALAILTPFALIENVTDNNILADLFPKPDDAGPPDQNEKRLGLYRATSVFPHPILFGVFSSIAVANVYYIYRGRLMRLLPRLGIVLVALFSSLSSAPYLAAGVQGLLILWDKIMRGRWYLLLGIVAFVFVFLSLASNRGPIIIFIETLTLNPRTAWWRVHIWNFGLQNVLENPIFGLGLGDWKRPAWLAETVDNFWLLMAMRHGIPGFAMVAIAILLHIVAIVRTRIENPDIRVVRTAYTVGLVGMIFTLCTVHVWASMAVFVMFYIGAGSFIYTDPGVTAPVAGATPPASAAPSRTGLAFSRFSTEHRRR